MNVEPIPYREPLFAEPAGRPGDWWESVSLPSTDVGERLDKESLRRRLPLDLLAALLVERALVLDDIADGSVHAARARAALSAAMVDVATIGPGRLYTSYVRTLRNGEYGYEPESDARLARRDLALPLRIHEAARDLDLVEACDPDAVDEAISWEIAAASSGQFMREWALRTLFLTQQRSPHAASPSALG